MSISAFFFLLLLFALKKIFLFYSFSLALVMSARRKKWKPPNKRGQLPSGASVRNMRRYQSNRRIEPFEMWANRIAPAVDRS